MNTDIFFTKLKIQVTAIEKKKKQMNHDMSSILEHVRKYECASSKSVRQEDRDGTTWMESSGGWLSHPVTTKTSNQHHNNLPVATA